MQKAFLVSNKSTQIAAYFQHRSVLEVEFEYPNLSGIDTTKIGIVDVDKFIYIHYLTEDDEVSVRSDLNTLRNLLSSAFFHVTEAVFIFVDNPNPMIEDLVYSALKNTYLTKDKIEIISHSGNLMLSDVSRYITGTSVGTDVSNSYTDVYIREADSEERARYLNVPSGIEAVLPVLTDKYTIYRQRAEVESVSSGVTVDDKFERPAIVSDFTDIKHPLSSKSVNNFIIAGERWTNFGLASKYLTDYFKYSGARTLIINCSSEQLDFLTEYSTIALHDLRLMCTPSDAVSVISCRTNQIWFVVEYFHNIRGIDNTIFLLNEEDYPTYGKLLMQLSENSSIAFVAHYNISSVRRYLGTGIRANALFLLFGALQEDFDVKSFKKDFKETIVAEFPQTDVDLEEFYFYICGEEGDFD